MNEWESRAKHNLELLLQAFKIHNEFEEESNKEKGEYFEPRAILIKLSVPNQELLDSSKELRVVGIDADVMALYVLQVKGANNDLISILLGDVMLISYCDRDLQQKMMGNLKTLYTYKPKIED